ncbi:MAG: FAD-dependent oxidoreductase [Betaproteobacteria bacterium]|nr:FAD-dependent oxidoreductase [Betaproteobacteria bacterium]
MSRFDSIVIGGGLVGSAVAYGLTRRGLKVAVLDEGDVAFRASRGNFGLVWVQSKGLGVPEYQRWSRESSMLWDDFSRELKSETGTDTQHEHRGGVHICITEQDFAERKKYMAQMHLEAGETRFEYEMLGQTQLKKLMPEIGPEVAGASFTPYDGAANPLYLLRGLHSALIKRGGRYFPHSKVTSLKAAPHDFTVTAGGATFNAPKLVLAAGLGNNDLGALVGLNVPVQPVRGQIFVTERVKPVLSMLTIWIRQMAEGSLLIGESREEAGFNDVTTPDVQQFLAARAIKMFPFLRDVRIVRHWSALRVMAPDGLPIYEQSAEYPGAFVATCHSGVTLAAAHALRYAEFIAAGGLPKQLARFSSKRF